MSTSSDPTARYVTWPQKCPTCDFDIWHSQKEATGKALGKTNGVKDHYRARCGKCNRWVHWYCLFEKQCHECHPMSQKDMFDDLVNKIGPEVGDGENTEALRVLAASIVIGSDDESAIATFSEVPFGIVRTYGKRLRDNFVWVDGKVNLGVEDWSDPLQCIVAVSIAVLCATGALICKMEPEPVGGPPVENQPVGSSGS